MKIINVENNKKKAYVQLGDIQILMNHASFAPQSVMKRILSEPFVVDEMNRREFMEFTDPESVEYIEMMDWIADFRDVYKAPEEQVLDYAGFLSSQIDSMKDRAETCKDAISYKRYYDEIIVRVHKLHSITEILWMKRGLLKMPLPVVPDSSKSDYEIEDGFVARQGVNPFQILISKKDHTPFTDQDQLSLQSFNDVYHIGIDDNLEHNEFFEYAGADWKLSKDGMYYVVTLKMTPVPVPPLKETFKDKVRKMFSNKKAK